MNRRHAIFLAAAILAGCATPYQPAGATGGFEEMQIDANTYRIRAKGNALVSMSTMKDHVLLRASELALQKGYSHFAILQSSNRYDSYTTTTAGSVDQETHKGKTYTTYTAPTSTTTQHPNAESIVRLLHGKPSGGPLAYEARAVYNSLAPKYKQP